MSFDIEKRRSQPTCAKVCTITYLGKNKNKKKEKKKEKKKTDVVAVVTFLLFNKNFYIVKSIKHNFTHKHFVVLFMWVVPIQDNVSLNYNPLFRGMNSNYVVFVHEFIYFCVWGDMGFYLFVIAPNNAFRLPTYPWWGSSKFVVSKLRF